MREDKLTVAEEVAVLGYDKDAIVNIYVANLAKYNEGELVGDWIALPKSMDEINAGIKQILGNDEEIAIHDYEAPFRIGEHDNIANINEIAEALKDVDVDEKVMREIFGQLGVDEGLTILGNGDYRLYENCYSMEDVAIEITSECGISENQAETYFDIDMLVRSLDAGGEFSEMAYQQAMEEEGNDDNIDNYMMDNEQMEQHAEEIRDTYVSEMNNGYHETNKKNALNWLTTYFDYEAFGRDLEIEGDFTYLGKGQYLEIIH